MKTTAAYYLLLLYIFAICKPVLPLVQDELAHIFWNAEHIATVHHHHGDHHAEDEIAKAAQDEDNNKVPQTSKTTEPVSIHIIVESSYIVPQVFIKKTKFGVRICKESSLSLDKHLPPPRCC